MHRFERLVSLPEPEAAGLSPDLEWMLRSNQADQAMVVETLVYEHYDRLLLLALSILDDPWEADQAVKETIYGVLSNKGQFWGHLKVSLYLSRLLIKNCRQRLRPLSIRRTLAAFSPWPWSQRDEVDVYPSTLEEADLWVALDSLTFRLRILLILHCVHHLSVEEIAGVLGLKEAAIDKRLQAAYSKLEKRINSQGYAFSQLKSSLEQSLFRRWPRKTRTREELAGVYAEINRSLGGQIEIRQRLNFLKKSALTTALVLLIGAGGFLASRSFPRLFEDSPGESDQANAGNVEPTGSLDREKLDPLGLKELDLPEPLRLQSSLDEIRQRMRSSERYWNSIFLDVWIIDYGVPGYIGPAKVYRNQAWISGGRKTVLSGEMGGGPEYWFSEGGGNVTRENLEIGSYLRYSKGGEYFLMAGAPFPAHLYGERTEAKSIARNGYLEEMISPDALADESQDLQVLGGDYLSGRQALLLRVGKPDEMHNLVWVDAQNGIILRWQIFGEADPNIVSTEMIVNNVEFNVDTPIEKFSSSSTSYERLAWTQHWSQTYGGDSSPSAILPPPQGRSPINLRIHAPEDTEFSGSRITFQWQPSLDVGSSSETLAPSETAELFTKGYFIAKVEMGDPWNILCERSKDGNMIAFLEPAEGKDGYLYAAQGMHWVDLKNQRPKQSLINGERASIDFAFSPDSHSMASWGCASPLSSCGVYVYDLATGQLKLLIPLSDVAGLFRWSSDGRYLSFVDKQLIYYVVSIEQGEVVYTQSVLHQSPQLPADVPVEGWDAKFPPERTGLEGCINPPQRMGDR
jgi:RNA polymerase sigma-70 factor (ECF subfamily)